MHIQIQGTRGGGDMNQVGTHSSGVTCELRYYPVLSARCMLTDAYFVRKEKNYNN